jgi:hypothetical protein
LTFSNLTFGNLTFGNLTFGNLKFDNLTFGNVEVDILTQHLEWSRTFVKDHFGAENDAKMRLDARE